MKKGILLVLMLHCLFVHAQYSIKGKIINSSTEDPISNVNVAAYTMDSVLVKTTVTDWKGGFILEALKLEKGYCLLTSIGYETITIQVTGCENIGLGTIRLKEKATALNEIVVTPERQIRVADRQLVYPTTAERQSANNALALLKNMAIRQLNVDVFQKSISSYSGEGVVVCVNGVKATADYLISLLPEDIIRVEYRSTADLFYAGDGSVVVVDLIVRHRDSGGAVGVNLNEGVISVITDNSFYARLNHKNSAFKISGSSSYTKSKKTWVDEISLFKLKDETIERKSEGTKAPATSLFNVLFLEYTLSNPSDYVFNAKANIRFNNDDNTKKSLNYYYNVADPLYSESSSDNNSVTPSFDFYFRKQLKYKQRLEVNLVGTYLDSKYNYSYKEGNSTSIANSVAGMRYSIIGHLRYMKEWKSWVLSANIRHAQGYAENNYMGNMNTNPYIKDATTVLAAEVKKVSDKIQLTLGGNGIRVWRTNGELAQTQYAITPYAGFWYEPVKKITFNYRFFINEYLPDLSEMNNVRQEVDGYTSREGEPSNNSYKGYINRLDVWCNIFNGWDIGLWGVQQYRHRPVNSFVYQDMNENTLIFSSKNQGYYSYTSINGMLITELVKDRLKLSLNAEYSWTTSKGDGYRHQLNNFFGGGELMFYCGSWQASIALYNRTKSLYGEMVTSNTPEQTITVNYRFKNCTIGIWVRNAFSKIDATTIERLTDLAPAMISNNNDDGAPKCMLSFSWNLSFGKNYNSMSKDLSNSDNDTGIFK